MTPPQRPGQPDWRDRRTPPPDPATRRLPRAEPPTEKLPRVEPPTEKLPKARRSPRTARIRRAPSPADARPTQVIPPVAASPAPSSTDRPRGPRRRNPQTVILTSVIVLALIAGGLAGAELYARHRADTILVEVAECVVEDGASVSFGVNPPFLWQHITGDYTNISVTTDGNRVQSAKGMTAEVTLADVRLHDSGDSKGTIGSLNATLSWRSAGIKDTVAENLPGVGNLVTGVRTDAAAGTVILDAGDNRVTAKPVVTDGDLNLEVLEVTGPLPKDGVQGALDGLTKKLNENYPLGIHADSVDVTDTGVVGKFSSRNASIPNEDANPCFARL
ncbi:LmeA family phospholipid-binding protein [Mycobacterium sp. 29Ha]|uniref:LmeA family phospholipid-binding protein n=1 Tax=Mycobacterium sp. 29Ha TaxID=2939268 RepID=UPI002939DCEA|nr:LmeA family phospholipid-binding protein [Mycobacterium sp. 29Ha]